MKNWLYLIVILFASCTEQVETETVSSYPSGNKKELITYVGDYSFLKKTQVYFENGQLDTEYLYEADGKTRRFQSEYHENGSLKLEGMLKNDQRFGVWKAFFSSGELQTLANYNEKGQEEGMYKVYAVQDGHHYVSYSGYYKEGERRGVWNFFNKDGVVINTKSFVKSQ